MACRRWLLVLHVLVCSAWQKSPWRLLLNARALQRQAAALGLQYRCVLCLSPTLIIECPELDLKLLDLVVPGLVLGMKLGGCAHPGLACLLQVLDQVALLMSMHLALLTKALFLNGRVGSPRVDLLALRLNPRHEIAGQLVIVLLPEYPRNLELCAAASLHLDLAVEFRLGLRRCAELGIQGFAHVALLSPLLLGDVNLSADLLNFGLVADFDGILLRLLVEKLSAERRMRQLRGVELRCDSVPDVIYLPRERAYGLPFVLATVA